jgi:hypothetical protein
MKRLLTVLAVLTMLATPGISFAQPITDTEVEKISESFSDEPFLCQDELYEQTATGHVLTHFTAAGIDDDGNFILPLHFRFLVHAKIVAVPLDGTGPTFIGHFRSSDSENIRSVRQGDAFVEVDTDHNMVVAKGSDGSKIRLREHFHFTFNANGDVTIEFEKVTSSC